MPVSVEDIVKTILAINQRRANRYSPKTAETETIDAPIGVDSIALMLNVSVTDIEPLIQQMIDFDMLETVSEMHRKYRGNVKWKKVRLKQE